MKSILPYGKGVNMDTYDRIMSELRGMVGKGKRFETSAALADLCDADPAFVHKHLQGKIKGDKIRPLLDFLRKAGVNMTFSDGKLPVMRGMGANAPEMPVEGDTVMAPVVGAVGAGPGQFNIDLAPIGSIPILKKFVHPDLFICEVKGDSMEPVVMDGGFVGAIPLTNVPRDGGIYIIYDDELGATAKYVHHGSNGKLILRSENPRIPPRELDVRGYEKAVVGEVLWIWHNIGKV